MPATTTVSSLAQLEAATPGKLRGRGACCASFIVIVVCMMFTAAGVFGTIKLFSAGKDRFNFADFNVQDGTRERETEHIQYNSMMSPGLIDSAPLYVVITTKDGSSWVDNATNFEKLLFVTSAVEYKLATTTDMELRFGLPRVNCMLCAASAYRSESRPLLAGDNNQSTIFVLTSLVGGKALSKMLPTIRDFVNATLGLDTVDVAVSSISLLEHALGEKVLPNLAAVEQIALPVGLCVFCVAIRGHFLTVIVPLFCIISTIAPALGATYLVSAKVTVTAFATEICLALVAALCIDMALFLNSRMREIHADVRHLLPRSTTTSDDGNSDGDENNDDRVGSNGDALLLLAQYYATAEATTEAAEITTTNPDEIERLLSNRTRIVASFVVWQALSKVAENIILTTVTCTVSFFAMAFLPTDFCRSIALCSAFGSMFCGIVSLTLNPALSWLLYPLSFEGCFHRSMAKLAAGMCPWCFGGGATKNNDSDDKHHQHSTSYGTATDRLDQHRSSHHVSLPDAAAGRNSQPQSDQGNTSNNNNNIASPITTRIRRGEQPSFYFGPLARLSARHPLIILFILAAVSAAPFTLCAQHLTYDASYLASAPIDAEDNGYPNYISAIRDFRRANVDTPLYLLWHNRWFSTSMFNFPDSVGWIECTSNSYRVFNALPMAYVLEKVWPVFDYAVQESLVEFGPEQLSLADIDAPNVFDDSTNSSAPRLISYSEAMALITANVTELLLRGETARLKRVWKYNSLVQHLFGASVNRSESVVIALRVKNTDGMQFNYGARGEALNDKLLAVSNKVDAMMQVVSAASANLTFPVYNSAQFQNSYAVGWCDLRTLSYANVSVSIYDYVFNGLSSPNQGSISVMHQVMTHFPLLIGLLSSALIIVMMLLLRSMFASLCCIVVVSFSVAWGLSFTTIMFHFQIFMPSVTLHVRDFYWIILLLSVVLSATITLDYFCFVFTRIVQNRKLGDSDLQACVNSVQRVGSTCLVAAAIMMLSLGALVFADTMIIAQLGATTTFSVLMCSLVAIPMLLPVMFSLARCCGGGGRVWWPRRMPEVLFEYAEEQ